MKKEVLVHGAMKYRCDKCGRSWWMFLEKGIEEFGKNHKPSAILYHVPLWWNGYGCFWNCQNPRWWL